MKHITLDFSENNPHHFPIPAWYRQALIERLMQSPQRHIYAAMQYEPNRLFYLRQNPDLAFTMCIADPTYRPIYQRVTDTTLERALNRASIPGGFTYEFCPISSWKEAPPLSQREQEMISLAELRPGALFVTDYAFAIKARDRYPEPFRQWVCVELLSGIYARFSDGDLTRVREIAAPSAPLGKIITLEELRPGVLFLAMNGVVAVKTAYRSGDEEGAQCRCVRLADGFYASFPFRNGTFVQEILLAQ